MRALVYLFALVLALLTGGTASAQEAKGWLGADVLDVTKAEADKLGWDTPHGAKLGVVASGSPADNAGLKTGDILSIDRIMVDTGSNLDAAVTAKHPGDELRLQVLSGGRERYIMVTLAEQPKIRAVQDQGGPLLMLDTGGHMGLIKGLAFTPDCKQLVSAGDDKIIRVWDWQSGKTVRAIRGQVGRGLDGVIYAMALSPDGRWLAAAGISATGGVRLYDFAVGKLVALLKGHTDTIEALAFSPDGKRLISGSHDSGHLVGYRRS